MFSRRVLRAELFDVCLNIFTTLLSKLKWNLIAADKMDLTFRLPQLNACLYSRVYRVAVQIFSVLVSLTWSNLNATPSWGLDLINLLYVFKVRLEDCLMSRWAALNHPRDTLKKFSVEILNWLIRSRVYATNISRAYNVLHRNVTLSSNFSRPMKLQKKMWTVKPPRLIKRDAVSLSLSSHVSSFDCVTVEGEAI